MSINLRVEKWCRLQTTNRSTSPCSQIFNSMSRKSIRVDRQIAYQLNSQFEDKTYSQTIAILAGQFLGRPSSCSQGHIERSREETVPIKVSSSCYTVLNKMKSDIFHEPDTVSINDVLEVIV